MQLVRFDPFNSRDLDRWFDFPARSVRGNWLPRVDLVNRENEWLVRVESAGIDADSLDVTVEGDVLSISGSRSFQNEDTNENYVSKEIFEGTFRRTVKLPDTANADGITARSEDGILEITVPRSPEVLPRKVDVEVATS